MSDKDRGVDSELLLINVAETKVGDVFVSGGVEYWKVLKAPKINNDRVTVRVQHIPDGGWEDKTWLQTRSKMQIRRYF